MHWVYYVLLMIVQVVGLAIAIFGLPGLWVMLAGTGIYALITHAAGFVSWKAMLALLILALASEITEMAAGSVGAKRAGASGYGMVGAMVGGVVGALVGTGVIPIPILGTIIGACLGSAIGAMGVEWVRVGELGHTARVGYGAAWGRLLGIIAKLTFGVAILIVTAVCAFP